MTPPEDAQRIRAHLLIWWIIWSSDLGGLLLVYFLLGRGPQRPVVPGTNQLFYLVGFIPLFVSIVIRWLVLPRSAGPGTALITFVAGLVLAVAGGFLGLFFGGPYRGELFLLGVLAVVQYMPFYARSYFEPKSRDFIPNN